MQRRMKREAKDYLARSHRHQIWKRIVSVLACVVVFCTTYALILPAITMEKDAKCGLEEHTHSEECYEQVTSENRIVPVCTLESLALHEHTEECLNENGAYICGYSDFVVHTHDVSCYDETGTLWCPLPEIAVHTHDETCYEQEVSETGTSETEPVHTHTEECYTEEQGDLICTVAEGEGAHTHSAEAGCYDTEGVPVCQLEENAGHQHTDSCYDWNRVLICGQPEVTAEGAYEEPAGQTEAHSEGAVESTEAHSEEAVEPTEVHSEEAVEPTEAHSEEAVGPTEAHSEGSAEPAGEGSGQLLICGEEKIVLHEHTPECYDENGKLTCGKVQVLEHIHSEACFQTVEEPVDTETLTCQLEESDSHTHGPLCYGTWKLICGLTEHTHSEECFEDTTAGEMAVETADIWEASLPEVIPEKWKDAVLAVAQSQIGYQENEGIYIEEKQTVEEPGIAGESGESESIESVPTESESTESMPTEANRCSRYGTWYGDPCGDWNAMFVSFCLHYAGIPAEAFPQESDASRWVETLQQEEYGLYRAREDYVPETGDLVFLDIDGDGIADRVGLAAEIVAATETEAARLRAIEGDVDGSVQYVDYDPANGKILGYGELPVEPRVEYTWSQDGMDVTVSIKRNADMPENAKLVVKPMSMDEASDAYEKAYLEFRDQVLTGIGSTVSYFNLYKIYLDVDGSEFIPQGVADINVEISDKQYTVMPHMTLFYAAQDGGDAVEMTVGEIGHRAGIFATSLSTVYGIIGSTQPISNTLAYAAPRDAESPVITAHKTIDAFRDGVDNLDTELDNKNVDLTNLYRLYLDAQVEEQTNPVDLLIVVDESGSMHMNYTWGGSGWVTVPDSEVSDDYRDMFDGNTRIYRDEAVRLVLNGAYQFENFAASKQNGLIYQFLNLNQENNVAVVEFHGIEHTNEALSAYDYNDDASVLMEWTNAAKYNDPVYDVDNYVNVAGQIANATNYCAGLSEAYRVLNDSSVKSNNHTKVMLFLSDGVPTVYLQKYSDGTYKKGGTGSSIKNGTTDTPNEKLQLYRDKSLEFFDMLVSTDDTDAHPDLITYTVGVSSDATDESSTVGIHSPYVMKEMAKRGNGEFYPATTTEEIREALKSIIHKTTCSNLVITDTLSDYVDIYTAQPDYKVTMQRDGEDPIVLCERGVVTEDGKGILKNVTYDVDTRTVTATFEETYKLEANCNYTLSYNVYTSQTAFNDYAQSNNTYPGQGDASTDFGSNNTSSNQGGYRSNTTATLGYKRGDESVTGTYPHPVVQVMGTQPVAEPQPVVTHKTIDAFRDGDLNEDTELDNTATDKTDLYRLYLDAIIEGDEKPIDLLIVVDQSGSMRMNNNDMDDGNGNPIYRDEAVRLVLNGTYNSGDYDTKKQNGLIYEFLQMNEDNKVAVVAFHGQQGTVPNYSYEIDAAILHGWSGDVNNYGYVDVESQSNLVGVWPFEVDTPHGTNYCAGLRMANDLLKDENVINDGNKKVMLFLSDGVPTFYFTLTDETSRVGSGNNLGAAGRRNVDACKQPTKDYFDDYFMANNPDVSVYTVGISGDINQDDPISSPEVLRYMADNGNGSFIGVESTEALANGMMEFIKSSAMTDVVIEDTLSQYVDVYQPEFKVTMKNSDGTVKTLWDKNGKTVDGDGIISNVEAVGKKVTVTFEPTYHPRLDYTYTLSFNVKATQTAYDEYAKKCEYTDKGDPNTDYVASETVKNETSSGQPGFYSNDNAELRYKINNEDKSSTYPHPVIQVATCDIALKKVDSEDQTKTLSGATFELYRKAQTGETGVSLKGLEGTYVAVREHCITDENGQLVIEDLVPGDYWFVETKAPDHYQKLSSPIQVILTRSADGTGQITGSSETVTVGEENIPALKVPNKSWGAELPHTGGTGTTPYAVGGLLVMLAAILLMYKSNKRRKEDFASS